MMWLKCYHPETEEEIEVRVYVEGPTRGQRGPYGEPLEEDTGLYWEISDAWDSEGKPMTQEEIDEITDSLESQIEKHLERIANE
jgi:hypothetical protein